jgi:hypothetical protein
MGAGCDCGSMQALVILLGVMIPSLLVGMIIGVALVKIRSKRKEHP